MRADCTISHRLAVSRDCEAAPNEPLLRQQSSEGKSTISRELEPCTHVLPQARKSHAYGSGAFGAFWRADYIVIVMISITSLGCLLLVIYNIGI